LLDWLIVFKQLKTLKTNTNFFIIIHYREAYSQQNGRWWKYTIFGQLAGYSKEKYKREVNSQE